MDSLPFLLHRLVNALLANLDLIILFLAFSLMTQLARRRATRLGLPAQRIADLSLWLAVGAVAGGRLAYILPQVGTYLSYPLDLIRINSGMYFYGALLGGLLVIWIYTTRNQLNFWLVTDLYAVYTPLAIALYRFGCLITNQCYGRLAAPPLGVIFPGQSQPRYPSELYEGLLALLLFAVFLGSEKGRTGQLSLSFLIAYPLLRAVVDFSRFNPGSVWPSPDQLLSLAVALGAGVLIVLRMRQGDRREVKP
jgi:phosphatidylglycerol:prolipoprotein diacylglycerol transferase